MSSYKFNDQVTIVTITITLDNFIRMTDVKNSKSNDLLSKPNSIHPKDAVVIALEDMGEAEKSVTLRLMQCGTAYEHRCCSIIGTRCTYREFVMLLYWDMLKILCTLFVCRMLYLLHK